MNVYFISGLAADKRVFKYIELPQGFEALHLEWIKPIPTETLKDYAFRLGSGIDRTKPFILVGLSLGGMIATEIAKRYPSRKTIIISSIPSHKYLPGYFRFAGKINLHKIIPVSLFKSASIFKRFFTAESPSDKKYIKQAIRESDPDFIKWAINAILNWNDDNDIEYLHIHGSKDELLPLKYTNPTHIIKGGGHLMVLNHYREINNIIAEVCNSCSEN